MGMFKRRHSGIYGCDSTPNPSKFSITNCVRVGSLFVSRIKYPNCTNFEGDKILVTKWNPRLKTIIDPHFNKGSGILARFEPTEEGFNIAIECAKYIDSLNI